MFSSPLVYQHGGKRRGEDEWMSVRTVKVDETIGGFRPFQGDERTFQDVERNKLTDELLAFLFQYTHGYFNAGFSHLVDTSSGYHRERVHASHYYLGYTFFYYKVGTRRSFPIV